MPLRYSFSPEIRYQRDGKGLLNLEVIRYTLALVRRNIYIDRQKFDHSDILTCRHGHKYICTYIISTQMNVASA